MREIKKATLYGYPGFMILDDSGKRGIFAWKDEGSRPRKRPVAGKDPETQSWKKIWFANIYWSDRNKDEPWRYQWGGGKAPFAKMHIDPSQFVLLFDLLPFLYKEWFGVDCPWNSTKPDIKKDFKKSEGDELASLIQQVYGMSGGPQART